MKILVKGKAETVSLDRVKPAHLECEPTTGKQNKQPTTGQQNKQQANQTKRANDQKTDQTSVKQTRIQPEVVKNDNKLANSKQQKTVQVKTPNKGTTYIAPHS